MKHFKVLEVLCVTITIPNQQMRLIYIHFDKFRSVACGVHSNNTFPLLEMDYLFPCHTRRALIKRTSIEKY